WRRRFLPFFHLRIFELQLSSDRAVYARSTIAIGASERLAAMAVNRNSAKLPRKRGLGCFALLPRNVIGILSQTARAAIVALVGAAMLAATSGEARSQEREAVSTAERCLAVNPNVSLGVLLPRTAARLKSNEPLKIVAVGSSSTVGLWVLASAATYPEVM